MAGCIMGLQANAATACSHYFQQNDCACVVKQHKNWDENTKERGLGDVPHTSRSCPQRSLTRTKYRHQSVWRGCGFCWMFHNDEQRQWRETLSEYKLYLMPNKVEPFSLPQMRCWELPYVLNAKESCFYLWCLV